jgi:DNA-binding transcriptional LysR family regulator
MKIPRIDDLTIFVRTAGAGSFSAAARLCDVTPAAASAAIKRLEEVLEVRLFERSTRRVRLSEAGARYLPHAEAALRALAHGECEIGDGAALGPLRVGLPSDLARSHLLAWIDAFAEDEREGGRAAQVEVRVSDRLVDLYQQPVDLALRYGAPEDSSLIALPLAPHNRRVLCAAPAYLERHGTPTSLAELERHNCLRFVRGDAVYSRWRFEGQAPVLVHGDRVADDSDIVRRWALAGRGVAYKSRLDVAGDLAAGRLVALLPAVLGEPAPLVLLVVSRERVTPGVRRLADALARRCRDLLAGGG